MQNQNQSDPIRKFRERAVAALWEGEFDRALQHLDQAIILDPDNEKLVEVWNAIKEATGDVQRLEAALKKTLFGNQEITDEELVTAAEFPRLAAVEFPKPCTEESPQRTTETFDASECRKRAIERVLHFAREEQAAENRRGRIDDIRAKANRLSSLGEHEKAVAFIEEKLKKFPGAEMEAILASIHLAADEQRIKLQDAIAATQNLLRDARFAECLEFLNSQPASIVRSPALQGIRQIVIRERLRTNNINETKRRIREAIQRNDFLNAELALRDSELAWQPSVELKEVRTYLESKWAVYANDRIEKVLAASHALTMAELHAEALKELESVDTHVAHASVEWQKKYREQRQTCQAGLQAAQKLSEARRVG